MTPFELLNWRTVVKNFCLLRIFWVWLINLPLNYQFGTFCHWPLSLWCLASTLAMLMKSLNTLSHKQLLHRECPSGVIKYLWTNIPSTIYDHFLWFVRVDIIQIDVKIKLLKHPEPIHVHQILLYVWRIRNETNISQ